MEGPRIYFTIPIFGGINVNETEVNLLIVTLLLLVVSLILTHKMEKIPRKKTQLLAEKIVITIDNLVESTMGKRYMAFAPYMMTLFASSVLGSLSSRIGLRSTTQDFNTTLCWALVTAFFIHYIGFKSSGFKGYLHSFAEPIAVMTPINMIGIVTTPMSMALRHFGNVLGGSAIMTLLYSAFAGVSSMIHLPIPALQVGVPAILSLYFDFFGGCMQAFIFCMLTMVYISNVGPSDES